MDSPDAVGGYVVPEWVASVMGAGLDRLGRRRAFLRDRHRRWEERGHLQASWRVLLKVPVLLCRRRWRCAAYAIKAALCLFARRWWHASSSCTFEYGHADMQCETEGETWRAVDVGRGVLGGWCAVAYVVSLERPRGLSGV